MANINNGYRRERYTSPQRGRLITQDPLINKLQQKGIVILHLQSVNIKQPPQTRNGVVE